MTIRRVRSVQNPTNPHRLRAIEEIDESNRRIGEELVPWLWGIGFRVSRIDRWCEVEHGEGDIGADGDWEESVPARTKIKEGMKLYLRPERGVRMEILTSEQPLKNITLRIVTTDESEQAPVCDAGAGLAFDVQVDFRTISRPDYLELTFRVSRDHFESLETQLMADAMPFVLVQLRGASGFYAPWTLGVTTTLLKLLPQDKVPVVGETEGEVSSRSV